MTLFTLQKLKKIDLDPEESYNIYEVYIKYSKSKKYVDVQINCTKRNLPGVNRPLGLIIKNGKKENKLNK